MSVALYMDHHVRSAVTRDCGDAATDGQGESREENCRDCNMSSNSRIITRLEDAENVVCNVFLSEFPTASLSEWDRDINDQTAEQIISAVGRASRINVRKFIEDLW